MYEMARRRSMTQVLSFRYVVLGAILIILIPVLASGQTYVLERSVISGGGARMSGSTYAVTGTLGQSSPIGVSSGSTYQTYHGFWHAVGGAPLEAMVLAIEMVNSTTARLFWDTITLATAYDLYRSTTPYFSAGGSPWTTVTAPTTEYQFTSGIGNASTNYYFLGKAKNASQTSPESNLVGEFDFDSASSSAKKDSKPGQESK